jgi:hypothetical protein
MTKPVSRDGQFFLNEFVANHSPKYIPSTASEISIVEAGRNEERGPLAGREIEQLRVKLQNERQGVGNGRCVYIQF